MKKTLKLIAITMILVPVESQAQMSAASHSPYVPNNYTNEPSSESQKVQIQNLARIFVPPVMPDTYQQIQKTSNTQTQKPPVDSPSEIVPQIPKESNAGLIEVQQGEPAKVQPVVSNPLDEPQVAEESAVNTSNKMFVFAGSEIGTKASISAIAGAMAPLPINNSQLGNGWVTRLIGFGSSYKYTASNRSIRSRVASTELSFGYTESSEKGWWGAYMGPSITYTSLSPDDLANKSRGKQWALDFQVDGERNITNKFKLNGSASYQAFANNAFWTRLRPLTRVRNNIFVGPEVIYQGDNRYRAWQAGAVITGIDVGYNTQLGFKLGIQQTKGESAGAYMGVELGSAF